jgi:uncharacterized protein
MKNRINFTPLLALIGLMLAGLMLVGLIKTLFFPNLTEASASTNPIQFLVFGAVSLIFSFALPAFIWLKTEGNLARFDAPISKDYKVYGIAFVLFVAILFVSQGAQDIFTKLFQSMGWTDFSMEQDSVQTIREMLKTNKSLLPITILAIAIVPAIAEELFFRKVIFGFLHKQTNTFWVPAILSSMFFAGLHLHVLSIIPIFLLGLGLTYAYYVTRNIWLPILFHALFNSLTIVYLFAEVEDSSSTHWTITLVASLLAAYLFLNWLPKKEVE